MRKWNRLLVCVGFLGLASRASGLVLELPPSLAPELLSETVPFVISPGELSAPDFKLEWMDSPIEGVSISMAPNSFEWVRIKDIFVLPRGRIVVETNQADAGEVSHWNYHQSFSREILPDSQNSVMRAEMPIALFSGKENPIHIRVKRGTQLLQSRVMVRFQPQSSERESQIFFDPSCSPFNVQAKNLNIPRKSYVFVGCRLAYVWGKEHLTSSLEIYVFWDHVGQTIRVDGLERASSSLNVWALRQRADPGSVRMESISPQNPGEFTLTYRIPDRQHWGYLGIGIGPYSYLYHDSVSQTNTFAPLITLYGGFIFTEAMRFVMFNATSIHEKFYSDLGIYLHTEQAKFFDKRISLNILLGGHVLFFKDADRTSFRLSAPQGVEVVWRDFIQRRYNLSVGSFIYPEISGQSYYNLWVRWGNPGFFGEINFISWSERDTSTDVFHRSLGLTVGWPLTRFF